MTRQSLEQLSRNHVDLGVSAELCKIVVFTDGGAASRPCEGAVASWGFVVVLMCGNETVRVIGCASGRVELDKSHPEYMCGTRLTNNVGELQASCCAVLWLAEQTQLDDSMRMDIRLDSKYAAAAAMGVQRCSSNNDLLHKLRHHWHCVNGSVVGGFVMTHVRSHKGEPWNEMADSLAEAAVNGFCVPGSRTELERWMTRFQGGLSCSSSYLCCDASRRMV